MVVLEASLSNFCTNVKSKLEIACTHMEKVVELSSNIDVVSNGGEFDKLIEIFDDFKKINNDLINLEEWSLNTKNKTIEMKEKMLNDACKLPSFYITERVKLSK